MIRCANPNGAVKATTKFSTTRLANAFAKDIYHKMRQQSGQREQDKKADKYKPLSQEEWNSHLMKIQNAFKKAVEIRDLEQVRAWLQLIAEPIHTVFKACKESPSVYGQYNFDPSRLHRLLSTYALSLDQLMVLEKRANLWFVERGTLLIIQAVQKEVRQLFENENYYCLRPLCWVVTDLYAQLRKSEYSQDLHRQRAYIGNFYAYPQSLFEELPANCPADTRGHFRQILHEGLSLWLLKVIKENDDELVESLCEAGRELVLVDETIDLKTDKALLQHLVLAGKLISDRLNDNTDTVSAKSLEMLFSDNHRPLPLGLSDLATTYEKSYPTIATDLYRFVEQLGDSWEKTHCNPLNGSIWSRGTRFRGGLEHFTTGLLYAAALIIGNTPPPDPIPLDITRVKARLEEMQKNHTKLENNNAGVLSICFDALKDWIDKCASKKAEQDK